MRATFKAPEECHLDGSWLGYLCARSLRDSRMCRHFLPPTERPPTDHRLVDRLRSPEHDGEYVVCAILYVTPDSLTVTRASRTETVPPTCRTFKHCEKRGRSIDLTWMIERFYGFIGMECRNYRWKNNEKYVSCRVRLSSTLLADRFTKGKLLYLANFIILNIYKWM